MAALLFSSHFKGFTQTALSPADRSGKLSEIQTPPACTCAPGAFRTDCAASAAQQINVTVAPHKRPASET